MNKAGTIMRAIPRTPSFLLLQDENSGREGRRYNEWHASRLNARQHARDAAKLIAEQPQEPIMADQVTEVDRFVPDYTHRCSNCGNTPVVTAEKDGKIVYQGELCGPCTWGIAAALDPRTWNA